MNDKPMEKKRIDAELRPTQVQVHAQYIKDFSFENPAAPASLRPSDVMPETDVNLVLDAVKINDEQIDDLYEATLTLKIRSLREGAPLFIAEIVYAALVSLTNPAPGQAKYILYVEVPQMLFPFARQAIANAVTNGGFPPLLLNPMDFRAMYESRLNEVSDEA